MTIDVSRFPGSLAYRLQQSLPGAAAQRRYAPELSYGRHAGPPGPNFREAAVVALCFLRDHDVRVALTLRPNDLPNHAGQVCFPGGEVEEGETAAICALRELHEELGIAAPTVQLLGSLTPIYIFASHFLVTPFVGWLNGTPEFQADAREVAEVIELPCSELMVDNAPEENWVERRGIRFRAPHFPWQGHRIWGATSMILCELAEVLRG